MSFLDSEQNDKIKYLERRVRILENKVNGGNEMSKLIKELVGLDCIIESESLEFFSGVKCSIIDVDDTWVRLICHEKKNDSVKLIRIDSIESITLE